MIDEKFNDEDKKAPPRPPLPLYISKNKYTSHDEPDPLKDENENDILKSNIHKYNSLSETLKGELGLADVDLHSQENLNLKIKDKSKLESNESIKQSKTKHSHHEYSKNVASNPNSSTSLLNGLKQKITKKIEETALTYHHNHPDSGINNALLEHLTLSNQPPSPHHTLASPRLPTPPNSPSAHKVGPNVRRTSFLSTKVAPYPDDSGQRTNNDQLTDGQHQQQQLPTFSAVYNKLEDKVVTHHPNGGGGGSGPPLTRTLAHSLATSLRASESKGALKKVLAAKSIKDDLLHHHHHSHHKGSGSAKALAALINPKVEPALYTSPPLPPSLEKIISGHRIDTHHDLSAGAIYTYDPGSENINNDTNEPGRGGTVQTKPAPISTTAEAAAGTRDPRTADRSSRWGSCDACLFPHGMPLPGPVQNFCGVLVRYARLGLSRTPRRSTGRLPHSRGYSCYVAIAVGIAVCSACATGLIIGPKNYSNPLYVILRLLTFLARAYDSGLIFFAAGVVLTVSALYLYDYSFGRCCLPPAPPPTGPTLSGSDPPKSRTYWYTNDFGAIVTSHPGPVPTLQVMSESNPEAESTLPRSRHRTMDSQENTVSSDPDPAPATNIIKDDSEVSYYYPTANTAGETATSTLHSNGPIAGPGGTLHSTGSDNNLPKYADRDKPKSAVPPKVPPSPKYRARHPFRVDAHEVWMNELHIPYDFETYRIQQTKSVHVSLEGRFLKLSAPKKNVPKRAVWDAKPIDLNNVTFLNHRYYDLTGSHVYLRPQDMPKKVYWSKKYPLCIKLHHTCPLQKSDGSPQRPPPIHDSGPATYGRHLHPVSVAVSAHPSSAKVLAPAAPSSASSTTSSASTFRSNYSAVASELGARLKGKIKPSGVSGPSTHTESAGGSKTRGGQGIALKDTKAVGNFSLGTASGRRDGDRGRITKSRTPSPRNQDDHDNRPEDGSDKGSEGVGGSSGNVDGERHVLKKVVKFSKEYQLTDTQADNAPTTTDSSEPALYDDKASSDLKDFVAEVRDRAPRGSGNAVYLFLFTRTNRDKEEWYWRFLRATQTGLPRKSFNGLPLLNTTLDPRSSTALWTSTAGSGAESDNGIWDGSGKDLSYGGGSCPGDRPAGIYFDSGLYTNIQDLRLYLNAAIFDELLTPSGQESDRSEARFMFGGRRHKLPNQGSVSAGSLASAETCSKAAGSFKVSQSNNVTAGLVASTSTNGAFGKGNAPHHWKKGDALPCPEGDGILTESMVRELNPTRIHPELCWLNAFLQRITYDFFKHRFMTEAIVCKLKRKLNKVKLPYFVEPLSLLDLDFGPILPSARLATRPWTNERGIWAEVLVTYSGVVSLTLSTKVNLMKLKAGNPTEPVGENPVPSSPTSRKLGRDARNRTQDDQANPIRDKSDSEDSDLAPHEEAGASHDLKRVDSGEIVPEGEEATSIMLAPAHTHQPTYLSRRRRTWTSKGSESEDSPESSDEEGSDESSNLPSTSKSDSSKTFGKDVGTSTHAHSSTASINSSVSPSNQAQSTGKRILKMVDKIANSKYFQQAAEMKYIKKGMEAVSNTPIVLTVEVTQFEGIMAINIPEPPSDRVWYGFRPKPDMKLSSKPKLGAKHVNITQVTDWIEKTLVSEFEKLLVIPNMDDVIVPLMMSGQIYPPPNDHH